MRTHTASLPCALGTIAPVTPAGAEKLRAMRAAAWHQQGIVVIPLDEIVDDGDRRFLIRLATRRYGARTTDSRQGRPWREGEVIDRGEGETWTVLAATAKSAVLQRSRDGALATLAQPGKEKS